RRMMPLNESIRGISAEKEGAGFIYTEFVAEQRSMTDNYQYMPLPYVETLKNPNLIQNKGW
ncbi:MAG: RagB/SusD family nutrient uptake outer membrane protein, partial [Proteiniphilum sp.]|nr:RagB/SusD family nutrient uptake outer membrane protein [Proteiniphilum sp.]